MRAGDSSTFNTQNSTLKFGAQEGTRTPTLCQRQDLNLVRLPIPPPGREARNSSRRPGLDQMNRTMRSPKFSTRRAARARARGGDAPVRREDIFRVLIEQGVPVTEEALAQALHVAPEHLQALHRAARRAWSATARSSATGATRSASRRSSISCAGACRDTPTASGFSCATTAARTSFSVRPRCARCCTAIAWSRASRASTGAAAPRARSWKCWSTRNQRLVGRLHQRARHSVRAGRGQAHQPRVPGARGRGRRRAAGAGRDRGDRRAAVQARAAGRRAWWKCSATTPIPAWRSRSRCASTRCRTCFRARRSSLCASLPDDGDGRGPRAAAPTSRGCRW